MVFKVQDSNLTGKKSSPVHDEVETEEPVPAPTNEKKPVQLTLNKQQREEPYVYTPLRISLNGPTPPPVEIIKSLGYNLYFCSIDSDRLAGGFSVNVACQRVLQEAYTDLYYKL